MEPAEAIARLERLAAKATPELIVKAKPAGGPRKVRPTEIASITSAFGQVKISQKRLSESHDARRQAIRDALESGYSLADIAAVVGVTRARIHQLSRE